MNNIRFDHRFYNDVRYSIMDEEKSLANIKTRVEDDISKGIWKEYGKRTEDWAKYAHAHHLWYPTTIYKNNKPYAYISNGAEYIEVYFLEERMFEYIYMAFKKIDTEKMFLTKIYIRSYSNKADKPLMDLERDINLIFSQKGGLNVRERTFLREDKVKVIEENKEAAHPVNVSQNWKKIPKYGEYDELLYYESIIKPGDLLNGVDINAPVPSPEINMDPEDVKNDHPWLPKDWNKN
ncbi:hypothetical protein OQX61_01665 [Pedobacter sp. PLR]|uniref:hypothetical protein n=1 Tax=Pedobacter sp. PLR TaxID=2994465 RepID=UPI00224718C3|nr:hypothetical protein [Pedobacter sp. PLR]MCX2449966.1 hypothetical protein [Pedobacter sp. PLR]